MRAFAVRWKHNNLALLILVVSQPNKTPWESYDMKRQGLLIESGRSVKQVSLISLVEVIFRTCCLIGLESSVLQQRDTNT